MAHVTADRVRDTSTTAGTGAFSVSGTAPTGYRTFSAVLSTSDTCWYAIQHQTAAEWEVGLGTYSSLNTITRTTVLASSNAGSAVNFSAGTKDIFITLAATKTVQQDNSGAVTIDANSSSDALRVTQTGAGNALLVEDSANPDSSPFVVNTNGVVGIGEASPGSYLSAGLLLRSSTAFTPQILAWNTTNDSSAPYWYSRKDRAGAVVNSGDALGTFLFQGYDGAAYRTAAFIGAVVDGTPGASDMPGRLVFFTTPDGSATNLERMRITSAGAVLIGTTSATGNVISTGNTDSTTTSITNQYHQYNSGATSGSGTKTGSNILMVALSAYAGTGAWIAYNGGMTSQSSNTVSQFRAFSASYVTTGGGTLTNFYGYFADNPTLTSGTVTNTYGFYGNISSGTNKWNFYAAGTANNYFAGNVGIGTTAPDALLTVNTIASFGDGAAATPSIAHKGDLNTGFWFPAADTIAASTAGTERMRIDSSGNLTAYSASTNVGTANTSPNILNIGSGATGDRFALTDYIGDTTYSDYGLRVGRYDDGANGTSILDHRGTGALKLNVVEAGYMVFATSATERMRIDSSGNVGIGTTTFGTSASKVLALGNATAPTTGPADTIQIYSTDLSAGNTMLSLYTEGTPVNANATAAATHRIAIRVNGTVYYLLANTAA